MEGAYELRQLPRRAWGKPAEAGAVPLPHGPHDDLARCVDSHHCGTVRQRGAEYDEGVVAPVEALRANVLAPLLRRRNKNVHSSLS